MSTSVPGPHIEVTPHTALIDVSRTIVLSGFAPHARVEVVAHLQQHDGSGWRSVNRFVADSAGQVDLRHVAPIGGDYAGGAAAPMGIVWSMQCVTPAMLEAAADEVAPLTVEIEARQVSGERADGVDDVAVAPAVARATLVQLLMAPGVSRREIREHGVVGTLFMPAAAGPHPAVVVLNGSGGGINDPRAALATISRMPLEYFANALSWLRETVWPDRGFVAVAGQSRGAELALLLGATYPQHVSAVIAYVPSAVVHGTLRAGAPGQSPDSPAWTLNGTALPNVWEDNAHADWHAFKHSPAPDAPIRQAPAFVSALADAAAVARSRIAVERIAGPILLISGSDDGFWPSSRYADLIVETLREHGFAHAFEHLLYAHAGHAILFPFVPTTRLAALHPVAGVPITSGGTPLANAHANEDSWPRVLAFLAAASAAAAAS
jgi:dienelactone hydrolase